MNNTVIAMGEIGHGFPVKEKLDKIKLIKLELAVQILDEVSERSQQKENEKWVRLSDVEEVINKYLN